MYVVHLGRLKAPRKAAGQTDLLTVPSADGVDSKVIQVEEDENQEHLVDCPTIATRFWSKIAAFMGTLNMDASDNKRKWILGMLPSGKTVGREEAAVLPPFTETLRMASIPHIVALEVELPHGW